MAERVPLSEYMEEPSPHHFKKHQHERQGSNKRGEQHREITQESLEKRLSNDLQERRLKEIKNVKKALLESGLKQEQVFVEKLPEDIVGKTEGHIVTVDPVVFKDYTELIHTFHHEKQHAEGILNEGLVEKIVQTLAPIEGEKVYEEQIQKMERVTDIIGVDIAERLYKTQDFTNLYMRFKRLSLQQERQERTEEETRKTFFEAFPELKLVEHKARTHFSEAPR